MNRDVWFLLSRKEASASSVTSQRVGVKMNFEHTTGEFTDRLQIGVIVGLVNFAKRRDTIIDKK